MFQFFSFSLLFFLCCSPQESSLLWWQPRQQEELLGTTMVREGPFSSCDVHTPKARAKPVASPSLLLSLPLSVCLSSHRFALGVREP